MPKQKLPEVLPDSIKVRPIKKTVLRYAKSFNEQGKPIMMIYPKNNPIYYPWRIIYNIKNELEVLSKKVEADGGLDFWLLKNKIRVKDPKNLKTYVLLDMYVRADEVKKV